MNAYKILNLLAAVLLFTLTFSTVMYSPLCSTVSARTDDYPTSLTISPGTTSINAGQTQTYTAIATFTGSPDRDISSLVTWSINAPDGTYTWTDNTVVVYKAGVYTVSAYYYGGSTFVSTGSLTVNAGTPTKLDMEGNTVAGAGIFRKYSVNLEDEYGNIATAPSDLTLSLSASSGAWYAGSLYGSSGSTPITSYTFLSGYPSGIDLFYKGDTTGTITLGASISGYTPASLDITVVPVNFAFISAPPTTIDANTISGAITVQLQDTSGNPITTDGGFDFSLTANYGGFSEFSDFSWGTIAGIIDAGYSTSEGFYYRSTKAGADNITAFVSDTYISGLTPVSASVTVNPLAGSAIKLYGSDTLHDYDSHIHRDIYHLTAGEAMEFTVKLTDSFGNIVNSTSDLNIALETNSTMGGWFSSADCFRMISTVTLKAGTNTTVPIYYWDSDVGRDAAGVSCLGYDGYGIIAQILTYDITWQTIGSGTIDSNATAPFFYDTTIRFTAIPAEGWSFSYWDARTLVFNTTIPDVTTDVPANVAIAYGKLTMIAVFTENPAIQTNATQGIADATVQITGHAFTAINPTLDGLTATFNGDSITLNNLENNGASGCFTATITIPDLDAGDYTLTVTDPTTHETDSITFTITTPEVTGSTDGESSGHVGDEIDIVGTGFNPNTSYVVTLGGEGISDVTTDSSGGFTCTATVPHLPGGEWSLAVSKTVDDPDFAEVIYTILHSCTLSTTTGPSGTIVYISGTGFYGYYTTATFNGVTVTLQDTNFWNGDYDAHFTVPASELGDVIFEVDDDSGELMQVTFTVTGYTITVTQTANGVISPSTTELGAHTNQTYTITPNIGFTIASITVDGLPISVITPNRQTVKFVNITQAHTITATYSATHTPTTYTLTVSVVGKGTVTPRTQSYSSGAVVDLKAFNSEGWTFSGWSGDAQGVTNTTITMDSNKAVTATFTQDTYSLTVNTSGCGTVQPANQSYLSGSTVELTAVAAPGYSFAGWGGDASGTSNPTTITMNGNMTVTASFIPNTYILTVITSGQGTVTPNNQTCIYGANITLTAVPDAGWSFSGWTGDASGKGSTSIIMDANKTVHATFTQDTYTLTIVTVGSGAVQPGNQSYLSGTSVDLKAAAASGWSFNGYSGDASGKADTAITMNHNMTVTATFTQNRYTLTIITVGQGSVSPGNQTYLSGVNVDLLATKANGWTFSGWAGDASGNSNCTLTMDGDKVVTATFTANTYTVTVSTVGQGSVSGGNTAYPYGASVTLTATPAPNFIFSGWSGDVTNSNPTITLTVTGDAKLTATFTAESNSGNPSGNNQTSTSGVITATETSSNVTYSVSLSGNITSTQITNMTITPNQSNKTTIIAFTITGEHGTHGFSNLTISKSAIPFGTIPVIYIDGVRAANQGYSEDEENYYVWYTTSFSTHKVTVAFTAQADPTVTAEPTVVSPSTSPDYLPYAALAAVLAVVAVVVCVVLFKIRKK